MISNAPKNAFLALLDHTHLYKMLAVGNSKWKGLRIDLFGHPQETK